MKSIYRIIISLLPIMSLFCSCEGEKEIVEINLPHHYKNVYMLGGSVNTWDSNNPQTMEKTDNKDVFVYELDLMHSIENKLIKFTVNTGDWDKIYYLVPEDVESGKSYSYLKEGINKMKMCSELTGDLEDHFWGVKEGESGRYKLTVNPIDQTLNVELIKRIEEPKHYANIYIMGGALNAWDSNNPVAMQATNNPDVFIYEINLMHSAENKLFKFTTGKGDWNKVFYFTPETVEADQRYAYLKEGINKMKICSEITGDLKDYFWGIKEGEDGKYRLTVNSADTTLSVERIGNIQTQNAVYLLGGALNAWDSNNPIEMQATDQSDVFTFELDLNHSSENKLFKFTINKGNWDKVYYLVPEAVELNQSYAYLKVGTNKMIKCSQVTGDLQDHFWGIKEGENGKYKLSVNLTTLALDVELIAKY